MRLTSLVVNNGPVVLQQLAHAKQSVWARLRRVSDECACPNPWVGVS